MYAVIQTGGKQYRVKAGDLLVVDKLDGEPGAKVAFNTVLMLSGDAGVVVGAPTVDGASVDATLIETRKGEKIKVFKKIRRQGYRRTGGHRQHETVLRVTAVAGAGSTETWDGEVDLTPKSALDARARGLKIAAAEFTPPTGKTATPKAKAKAAPAEEAPKAAVVEAPVEAAPAAEAPAKPAKKAAAPKTEAAAEAPAKPAKKAAAPKAEAEAAPAKPAAKKPAAKKTKADGDDA
jgi:large subunit ribosomal protein L21